MATSIDAEAPERFRIGSSDVDRVNSFVRHRHFLVRDRQYLVHDALRVFGDGDHMGRAADGSRDSQAVGEPSQGIRAGSPFRRCTGSMSGVGEVVNSDDVRRWGEQRDVEVRVVHEVEAFATD